MVALAGRAGARRARRARETFASIERQGRESLNEMRQMLGPLRSDERDTAPQPTLADLEALLARARQSGVDVELRPRGERRPLPAGIELAAYRVVQHALEALPERATVDVGLRYLPDALELEIRGPLADGGREARSPRRASASRRTAGASAASAGAGRACVLRSRLPVGGRRWLRSSSRSRRAPPRSAAARCSRCAPGVARGRGARGGAGDRGASSRAAAARSRSRRGPPGALVRSRRELVDALAERNRQLEAEQDALAALAVRRERARIARELHDIVAHHLAVMVIQAGAGRLDGAGRRRALRRHPRRGERGAGRARPPRRRCSRPTSDRGRATLDTPARPGAGGRAGARLRRRSPTACASRPRSRTAPTA